MAPSKIHCTNPNKYPKNPDGCPSPDGKFDIELPPGAELVKKTEEGAESYVTECWYCQFKTKVWLKNLTGGVVVRNLDFKYEPLGDYFEPLEDLESFWVDTARDVASKSIDAIEEAAKQLIAIITLLQGIYFAAISFSALKTTLSENNPMSLLFLAPIILWFFSLVVVVFVFLPKNYTANLNSPSMSKKMYNQIVEYKQNMLFVAYIILLIGFIPLIYDAYVYLFQMQVTIPTK